MRFINKPILMNTLFNNYKSLVLQVPAAVTATAVTTGVDISAYGKDLEVDVLVGAVTGTSPTLSVAIQTSPDNSTFTTQSTISLVSGSANLSAQASVIVPPTHRYVRLSYTAGGTTPSFTVAVPAKIRAINGGSTLNSATPA